MSVTMASVRSPFSSLLSRFSCPATTIPCRYNSTSSERPLPTAAPEFVSAAFKRRQQVKDRFGKENALARRAKILSKNQTREWHAGDVYSPHDLSPEEMRKWKRRARPSMDVFDSLSMDPLNQYKNFSIMSEYMTEMGRIKHSQQTGLRPVNQRKVAKAIRRAIGLGLMPSVYRHPEIILLERRT